MKEYKSIQKFVEQTLCFLVFVISKHIRTGFTYIYIIYVHIYDIYYILYTHVSISI